MVDVQEIEVTIAPDGKVRVRVRGVEGPGCLDLTKSLERYLGGRVVSREHTDEYHQVATGDVREGVEIKRRGS